MAGMAFETSSKKKSHKTVKPPLRVRVCVFFFGGGADSNVALARPRAWQFGRSSLLPAPAVSWILLPEIAPPLLHSTILYSSRHHDVKTTRLAFAPAANTFVCGNRYPRYCLEQTRSRADFYRGLVGCKVSCLMVVRCSRLFFLLLLLFVVFLLPLVASGLDFA